MRKQKFLTARSIVFALTLAAVVTLSATDLRAQSGEPPATQETAQGSQAAFNDYCGWLCQLKERQAQRLEGSWAYTVTPAVPPGVPPVPSFGAYQTFARGGGGIGSDRTRPFSSPQHGTWSHLGGDEFAHTLIQDEFDVMGNFRGTLKVKSKIVLTGRDELVGVATAEIRDAAGNLTATRCATFRAERIKIEPLAPQCQSIMPPQ